MSLEMSSDQINPFEGFPPLLVYYILQDSVSGTGIQVENDRQMASLMLFIPDSDQAHP